MQKNLKYVDMRLRQWADWYRPGNLGLGYPPMSIEYRLMKEGIIQPATGLRPLPTNKDAEEVENLMKEMAKENFTMAQVLKTYYLSRKLWEDKVIEECARVLKLSCSRINAYLSAGRHWFDGALRGIAYKTRY